MYVCERVGQKWHMKKLITRPQKNKPREMNDTKQNEMKKDTQKRNKMPNEIRETYICIYSQTRTRIFIHQQQKKKPTDTECDCNCANGTTKGPQSQHSDIRT